MHQNSTSLQCSCLQCFDAVGWAARRASGLEKKPEWWGTGMVICLERDADLNMAQLMPLILTVSRFGKIQIGFTFLVLTHPGSPRKRAVKCVCVFKCTTKLMGRQLSLPHTAKMASSDFSSKGSWGEMRLSIYHCSLLQNSGLRSLVGCRTRSMNSLQKRNQKL